MAAAEPKVSDLTQLTTLNQVLEAGKWEGIKTLDDVKRVKASMLRYLLKSEEHCKYLDKQARETFLPPEDFALFHKLGLLVDGNPARLGRYVEPLTEHDQMVYNQLMEREKIVNVKSEFPIVR